MKDLRSLYIVVCVEDTGLSSLGFWNLSDARECINSLKESHELIIADQNSISDSSKVLKELFVSPDSSRVTLKWENTDKITYYALLHRVVDLNEEDEDGLSFSVVTVKNDDKNMQKYVFASHYYGKSYIRKFLDNLTISEIDWVQETDNKYLFRNSYIKINHEKLKMHKRSKSFQ
jgi:hypothetical protein